MKNQVTMILEALKKGATLTPLSALQRFGCFKLSTRIGEMEKAGLCKVKRGWLKLDNGKQVRTYKLLKKSQK